MEDPLTLDNRVVSFLYARQDAELPTVWFSAPENLEEFRRAAKDRNLDALRSGAAGTSRVGFDDLSQENKAAIIKGFVRSIRHKNRGLLSKIVHDYLYVFEKNRKIGLSSFDGDKVRAGIYAGSMKYF